MAADAPISLLFPGLQAAVFFVSLGGLSVSRRPGNRRNASTQIILDLAINIFSLSRARS
jgi:hypothetical protein